MIETGHDTLTAALVAFKSQAEALKTKVDEQRVLLAAEKAKGRRAEKATVDSIQAALDALLPAAENLFVSYTKLQKKASGSPTGPSILPNVTAVIQDADGDMLYEQIENLMEEAGVVEAAIPGVTTEADATTFVEALQEKENQTEADKLLIFLYEKVQALEQRLAAAPTATTVHDATAPTSPDAPTPGDAGTGAKTLGDTTTVEGTPDATSTTPEAEDESESDYIDTLTNFGKNALERMNKFLPKRATLEEKQKKKIERAVKDALSQDFDVLIGILENPERSIKRKLLNKRESVLLPILAVLEVQNVLKLTQETKTALKGYQEEVAGLKEALNSTDNGDAALSSLLTWARLNLHRFNALPEVAAETVAPTEPVVPSTPDGQVKGVTDVSFPGDGGTSPNEVLDGSGNAVAPETTPKKETDAKKALKLIYTYARGRVPEAADESTKLNALASRDSGHSRLLNEAVRKFQDILDGKVSNVDESSAELQALMVILLVMSEVESAYNKLIPKSPATLAELNALVAKISS